MVNDIYNFKIVKSKLIFVTICMLSIMAVLDISFIITIGKTSYNEKINNTIICILGSLLFFWVIWSWYKLRKEILCPYIIFFGVAYIFMFGQSLLNAFGIRIDRFDLNTMYPTSLMIKANAFTSLSLGMFHLGALITGRPNTMTKINEKNIEEIKKIACLNKGLSITGWILFVMSSPFVFKDLYNSIKLVVQYGYVFIYDESLIKVGLSNFNSLLSEFFVPSLWCLLIYYKKNRLMRNLISIIIIIRIVLGFAIGGRSIGMVLAICTICLWHYVIKPIRGHRAIFVGVIGLILISFMPVIFSLRELSGNRFEDYFNMFFKMLSEKNLIVTSLGEMGGSMFPLINVINLVPHTFPFRHGDSYLYSFLTIVPNLGFWSIHPSAIHSNLSNWLQMVLNLDYGPGFSMTAEAYINFGWWGLLFLFGLGGFYGYLFSLINRREDSDQYNAVLLAFIFSILSLTVLTSRNNFISTVRAFVYYSMPIYVMCLFFAQISARNIKEKSTKLVYKLNGKS